MFKSKPLKKGQTPGHGRSYRIVLPRNPEKYVEPRERKIREFFARTDLIGRIPSYAWRRRLGIPKKIDNIVFVCIGNTGRSFAAAKLMQQKLRQLGLNVKVESMGLSAKIDSPAEKGAADYLRQQGISEEEISAHKAKNWVYSEEANPLLDKVASSGIIITLGAGIKHGLLDGLLPGDKELKKRIYTLRGIVTGKESWEWRKRKMARLQTPDPFFEAEKRKQLAPQEIDFLVHELINVLGPTIQRK